MFAITSTTTPSMPTAGQPATPPMRQAVKDLTAALRNDDLPGARQAYAAVVKAAPESAQWKPDGHFAEVGRALVHGDLAAAQEAFKHGLDALREVQQPGRPAPRPLPPPDATPLPAPAPSSTGGVAGSRLHLQA